MTSIEELKTQLDALTERVDLLQHWHVHPMESIHQTGNPVVAAYKPAGKSDEAYHLCGHCLKSFNQPHICEGPPWARS